MRPVERGPAPRAYKNYQEAGPDLQARIGDYCSYCERQIETNLAVEHVQPKDLRPALRNTWTNFLLGCVHCNSSKGATAVSVQDYLWPDVDNTLRAFEYGPGGLVSPYAALSNELRAKAEALIQLVGLDKDPGNPNPARRPTESDKRWLRRNEAWQKAQRFKEILQKQDTPDTRELIIEVAKGKGMFSIYWAQFAHEAEMRMALREHFVGTSSTCFDANECTVPRPGGQF